MQQTTSSRSRQLIEALESRILVMDGATGTAIQNKNLTASDFGGEDLEGCNENLTFTRPDVVEEIHDSYLAAGCDIIETNTFGATPLVLAEYGIGSQAYELNKRAAEIARKAADRFSSLGQPRFVAGAMGPTTKAISVTGGITFAALQDDFFIQAKGLLDGGVDYFLLETCQDTRNVKAGILAIEKLFAETGQRIPVAVSGTIEPMGTMLAGQSVEAFFTSLAHLDLLYIGLNCATGPEFMTDHIRSFAKLSPFRVACVPNAGLPDESGCYLESPEMVARVLERFVSNGWVNVIGGCCGTHAGHIRALVDIARGKKPKASGAPQKSYLSGIDFLEITDEMRPLVVGERTNVIGSKKFKTLIVEGKFDEASDIARAQIKNGAQIIDICLANPDRNELEDMRSFMETAAKKIRAPFMIDSTDAQVIELALTYSQGKAIINSINLEDGEERFDSVIPLAKKFGAALVVGTIDDDPNQGMGISRQRKLEIAERSYKLLTEKYGIPEQDIYWDPLVFPCGTGDAQYVGSAVETIEGIRLIKQRYPNTKTVLGISNVSFGLPAAGREVLNSVFLYHCVQAGLDLAIVNAEKLERYASISDEDRRVAENLLYNRSPATSDATPGEATDPVAVFAAHFRERKAVEKTAKNQLPLMDRLPRYIIDGSKDGLVEDLTEALKILKPLEIINGPLMKGMDEVGRLFNSNQLIVAEVLQSAEVMKAAVGCLEPFMEKKESSTRGKVVLATVKGDVHDIGKNLVEIILANNGFEVVNLGIKVLPEQLIQAIKEHKPDIIGLSGLLVKSAQQMVITADDFTKAGVNTPMLVGGAALTSNFVDNQISKAYSGTVAYASDAMSGLELAKTIVDPEKFEALKQTLKERRAAARAKIKPILEAAQVEIKTRSQAVQILQEVPKPTDLARHVLKNTPIEQIWKFINPLMLYGRHLGIPGSVVRMLERESDLSSGDSKTRSIWNAVQEVKEEYKNTEVLQPSSIHQFFRAESEGNSLKIFGDENASSPLTVFDFPRQLKPNGLCLSDYTWSREATENAKVGAGNRFDTVAFFVVTVGKNVRQLAENLKNRGDYLKSHIIQALALESAEAYAEMLHGQIRKSWGFPDAPEMTMMERFQAKYHGKRYSFGYPACPRLDDQATLWKLLNPTEIGVQLTDGFMMDPESSVSALVFHHSGATYFSVGRAEEDNR
jgi:5-methyltetrahydrofolate--homocysteine methyltransferase